MGISEFFFLQLIGDLFSIYIMVFLVKKDGPLRVYKDPHILIMGISEFFF